MRTLGVVVAALLILPGCLDESDGDDIAQDPVVTTDPPLPLTGLSAANITFNEPVLIDATRPGGEPVIFVTPMGNLLVAAHPGPTHSSPTAGNPDAGLLMSFSGENMMWRSTDLGSTWDYVGNALLGSGPRDTAFSISDPDLTADAAGNIYHVSLYNPGEAAVGLGMSRSADDGVTWAASPLEPGGDRPWLVGRGVDEVFVAVHGSIYQTIPGSGGLRLQQVGHSPYSQPDTNMQLGPDGNLYHGGFPGVAKSTDSGATWSELPMNRSEDASSPGWMMAEPVFDDAGYLYATWFVDNAVHYGVWAPNGTAWVKDWTVADLPGTHLWPWMVAGGPGQIAIAWLGSLEADSPEDHVDWHVYVAFVDGASGPSPDFTVVDATPTPIHNGVLCQSGVGCAGASDRRLGDFFTTAILPDGRLAIAVAATSIQSETGNDGWWGRPVFIAQAEGPRLR